MFLERRIYVNLSICSSQVGMDKALNQLSVPLGQLREEVMVCVLITDTVSLHKSLPQRLYACWWLLCVAESAVVCQWSDSGHRQPAVQTGRSTEKEGLPLPPLLFLWLWSFCVALERVGIISHLTVVTYRQVCVLRLIQVVRSVEKIEKILHSQNSKESNSLEISRWGITWTNSAGVTESGKVIYQAIAV